MSITRKTRPVGLKHSRSRNGSCLSVFWNPDGNLLTSRQAGFILYDKNFKLLKKDEVFNEYLQCVTYHPDGYLFMSYSPHINRILLTLCDEKLKVRKIVDVLHGTDTYYTKKGSFSQVCYDKHSSQIIAVDTICKRLKVYSKEGEFQHKLSLAESISPGGIYALPNGYLLIGDANKTVTKYKMEDKSLKEIWKCKDLISPSGITADDAGFIYVASSRSRKVYILASNGIYNMLPLCIQGCCQIYNL